MRQTQPVSVDWQTSTYCSSSNCIQVAAAGDSIMVRDSKNPEGPVLRYSPDEWQAFLDGVANGDFATTA